MNRPSQNLDKILIESGKQMMAEEGISNLSIRHLCSLAGVNTGMFKYHFENRANFLRIVHNQLYDEFFAFLQDAADRETDSLGQLRACLLAMTRVCREQRSLFISLLRDHMNDKLQEIFGKEDLVPKELFLILKFIGDCKADGVFAAHMAMLNHFRNVPHNIPLELASESACIERFDILLKGLKA